MSVDILGDSGEGLFFSNAGWAFLLAFAQKYGWTPMLTQPPKASDTWDGCYDPAQGQRIVAADAAELANALERGLNAPDRARRSEEVAELLGREAGAVIQPFEFSPRSVDHWQRFILIARNGPFTIS